MFRDGLYGFSISTCLILPGCLEQKRLLVTGHRRLLIYLITAILNIPCFSVGKLYNDHSCWSHILNAQSQLGKFWCIARKLQNFLSWTDRLLGLVLWRQGSDCANINFHLCVRHVVHSANTNLDICA